MLPLCTGEYFPFKVEGFQLFSSLHFWSCRGKWKCMTLQCHWAWHKAAMSLFTRGPCMVSHADQWIWVLLYCVLKCTGKTLLLAVNKLDSNLQKKKKKSLCQLLITYNGMKTTEGNSAFRKECFLVGMLYTVTLVALEVIIHRGWKECSSEGSSRMHRSRGAMPMLNSSQSKFFLS